MRCATSLTRKLLLAALLLASGPALADAALTRPQARMVAAQALEAGDTALAIRLARGLIEADRRDTGAWYWWRRRRCGRAIRGRRGRR
ncbi:hypothetical protein ACFSZS_05040 [Seohaeicola zhoushanensis]